MPNPRYIARIEAKNLRVEIWLNGIPAAFLGPGLAEGVTGLPLNEYVAPGRNVLGVTLHAGPLPSRSDLPWGEDRGAADAYTGPASLRLRLGLYTADQPVQREAGEPLAAIDWEGAARAQPERVSREFPGVDAMGRWAWQDAEAFSSDREAAARDAAWAYLSRLHGLLAAGQFEAFADESAIKIEEYSRAYGVARRKVRQEMLAALQGRASGMKLRPLVREEVDLRLIANRRMFECLRPDRHRALEFVGEGTETFFLPAMIGIVKSEWRLLR